jgi:phosphotriesterase-related protein
VLLSQDAGWYRPGEPNGGLYRGYSLFFTDFLPMLRETGVTDEEIRLLTVDNPAKAYAIGVRVG